MVKHSEVGSSFNAIFLFCQKSTTPQECALCEWMCQYVKYGVSVCGNDSIIKGAEGCNIYVTGYRFKTQFLTALHNKYDGTFS